MESFYRKIDRQGKILLSAACRGNPLFQKTELRVVNDTIIIAPFKEDGNDNKLIKYVDSKNRIQLPMSIRRMLGIENAVEVTRNLDGTLLVKKAKGACVICDGGEVLEQILPHKYICTSCIRLVHDIYDV